MQTATRTIDHFINGSAYAGTGRSANVWNPATGEVGARVALADKTVVDAAVSAASAAFGPWSETPPHRRAQVLFEFRDRVVADMDRLARIITSEHGKTIDDAHGEIQRGLDVVEFACGIPHLLKGDFSAGVGRDIDTWSERQPLGVCVGITPFNFPAMVPMWMFPIALACGNTFVLKPSERDPSLSFELAVLLKASGLPDGVLNVVNGDASTVDALMDHPDVAAISFVGSTPVARRVFTSASERAKRVQALGSAKNHLVVMPDAPLDETVEAVVNAAYGSAGERCMAVSVVVVVGDETADALVDRASQRIARMRVGPGHEDGVEMGPLVTREHRDRVAHFIDIGIDEGARAVVDGRPLRERPGFFLGATLLDHVTPAMRVYREEIFGPVLCVVRVNSLDEALALVNAHEYGNGASIFTSNGSAARYFDRHVTAGMVGINIPIPVPMAFHSFGGWKNSLFGDHYVHGADGVRFYTRVKTTTARWSRLEQTQSSFSMPTMK